MSISYDYPFQYVGYNEGPLEQKNVPLSDKEKTKVEAFLTTTFRWRIGLDVMGVQHTIRFRHQNEQFFAYSIVICYKVEDGVKIAEEVKRGKHPDLLGKQLMQSSLDFLRGVLSVLVRNTAYSGLTIPYADIDDIYKEVNWKIEKI